MDDHLSRRIVHEYATRASIYDAAGNGWHEQLGKDMGKWLAPQPGHHILDLACGTGLVTIPLAQRVGSSGKVIAIDLTPAMVEIGMQKIRDLQTATKADGLADIEWHVQDITSESILAIPSVKHILDIRGGFDGICICSALVLLPDQRQALEFWVSRLLKSGGRIIADVPTEHLTTQYMMSYHLPAALSQQPYLSEGRAWVKDDHNLAGLFKEVGLDPEKTVRTKSYIGETWYDGDEQAAHKFFNDTVDAGKISMLVNMSGTALYQARDAWVDLWMRALTKNEHGILRFRDGHWLYVCVGRKL